MEERGDVAAAPTRLERAFRAIDAIGWAVALHDRGCCTECGHVAALHEATMAGKAAFVYYCREATWLALQTGGNLVIHAGMCSPTASMAPIADTLVAALHRVGLRTHLCGQGLGVKIPAEDMHFLAAMRLGYDWEEEQEGEGEEGWQEEEGQELQAGQAMQQEQQEGLNEELEVQGPAVLAAAAA